MHQSFWLWIKTTGRYAHLVLSWIGVFWTNFLPVAASEQPLFKQVVIWGHKLHTHTHSYIHEAFFQAFTHLGYPTYWLDQEDSVEGWDFSGTLFLTEGQADAKIPICADSLYILHNCDPQKYADISKERKIILQVYTDDVLRYSRFVKIAPCCYADFVDRVLYMPWATDLLPHQIDDVKAQMCNRVEEKTVYWVGTIGAGEFGNIEELTPFIRACQENGVSFVHQAGIDPIRQRDCITRSFLAPAIVGRWQQEKGYIPCRIFKNISYGKMGLTNSYRVYELFEKKILYNPDTYQLFLDGEQAIHSFSQEELFLLMDFVKEHHTYLNRIDWIVRFFHLLNFCPFSWKSLEPSVY